MSENKFISLDEYSSKEKSSLVNETMILEKGEDDEGPIGHIINRGISFIPRAMRFSKAKRIMKKSLAKFINKGKRVVDKFAKSFQKKVATIEPVYKKLKKEVDDLASNGDDIKAKNIMETQLKELEEYKKQQMDILDKGIDDILQAYTRSIEQRIDMPGFVLNVELSEKGKGELKAKWEELGVGAKMKIEERKTVLITSKGWKKIDMMIAEIKAFVEARKYAAIIENQEFYVDKIERTATAGYKVEVFFRIKGARFQVTEKGLLIGTVEQVKDLDSGATKIKYRGRNDKQLGGWNAILGYSLLEKPENEMIQPYMIVRERKEPIYGDPKSIDAIIAGKPATDDQKQNMGTVPEKDKE